MNFDAVKRQAHAAQIAADMGCYELADCLIENAKQELTKSVADEIAKRAAAEMMKPGGLLHGLLFGQASGGVVKL